MFQANLKIFLFYWQFYRKSRSYTFFTFTFNRSAVAFCNDVITQT
jgi:hypothetical protein